MPTDTGPEWTQAAPTAAITLGTLILGWLVTTRVSDRWDKLKARRERDLRSLDAFYELYGRFFATWKLWEVAYRERDSAMFSDRRQELLREAASAEGELDALWVRVTSERVLSSNDIELLGCYRQAFQRLRESIREDVPLVWGKSNHQEYVAFKMLSSTVAGLLSRASSLELPERSEAAAALDRITHNTFEGKWRELTPCEDALNASGVSSVA